MGFNLHRDRCLHLQIFRVQGFAMSRSLFSVFLLLFGCATLPDAPAVPGPAVPPPEEDSCGAGEYAALVGQDATALERVLIMREVRVIRPGQPVTADFRPQRINFVIGSDEKIERISCG